ncbi:hypothetical protein BJD66_gp66 [Gordonia phage Emalyn]|uniref:Uncharacterized protein n=1 Tax=Gordonia phage Emalyn TaxID=1821552 RepID=A0A142KC02_9CAUD|nr:hypothetical protein BJD66_gp66 [Gordonia phage Emalyn]AMS03635.1 hypothetical protein SEA_EMALYN_66 [Gordonia phage Emalyn]
MNRDTEGGLLARVVCDKAKGVVYVNDVPVDGYIAEDGIEVVDVANHNSIMQVVLSIFAESVEMIDNYVPRVDTAGDRDSTGVPIGTPAGRYDVGVCYLAVPTLNRDLAGKVIGLAGDVSG